MDKNLMNAVAEKNLTAIKTALTSINLKDRNFSTGAFEEGLKYVESQNIAGLYDEFDGESFKPESEWDQSYWTYINVSLMDNFCRERIEELKRVGRKIYPVQETPQVQPPSVQSSARKKNQPPTTISQRPTTTQTRSGRRGNSESAGLPLPLKVVGAAVVTGVGFAVGGPAVGVGVAVAAGGAIAWTSKN